MNLVSVRRLVTVATFLLVFATAIHDLWAQPQVSQMSGVPLPTGDLPAGAVSVRVVRESLQNNLTGVDVELDVNGVVQRATTDAQGRAQFAGVAAGVDVEARASVGDERLASQRFRMPPSGGVRLILAFGVGADRGVGAGAASPIPSAPAERGAVMLGDDTRFVIEIVEGALEVYCLLHFTNTLGVPVDPGGLVSFAVPADALGTALLEGTSPLATLTGQRVDIAPPFPPGPTIVQVGYRLPITSSRLAFQQVVPVATTQTTVVVRKLPGIDVASSQITSRRDVPIEDRTYILGSGPALAANDRVSVEISGLPAHASWPRYVSLSLAAGVLLAGMLLARPPEAEDVGARRARLSRQREHLLQDLVKVHERADEGRLDEPTLQTRREALIAKLERVYTALDDIGDIAGVAVRPPPVGAVAALDARGDEH